MPASTSTASRAGMVGTHRLTLAATGGRVAGCGLTGARSHGVRPCQEIRPAVPPYAQSPIWLGGAALLRR